jgi:hypothetical protein
MFVRLLSHQPAVLFSQNKSATSHQPAVLFSQNKSATSNQPAVLFFQNKPAISHQADSSIIGAIIPGGKQFLISDKYSPAGEYWIDYALMLFYLKSASLCSHFHIT